MPENRVLLFSRRSVFVRLALPLALAAFLVLVLGFALPAAAQDSFRLLRMTQSSDGTWRSSSDASLNHNGTKIAFYSDSDFFNQGNINDNQYEIWLYDLPSLTHTRITTASNSDRISLRPSINANGTRIAFQSDSDLLSQGLLDNWYEIFLYDTTTMTFTRITTASVSGRWSFMASINADGTKIAFQSDNNHLGGPLGPNDLYDIWLYDTSTVTYTRITSSTDPDTDWDSTNPSISGDGTRIAFESKADLLNEGLDDESEVWLFDTSTMTLTRVTTSSGFNRNSLWPSISGDGSKIAFHSNSEMLGESLHAFGDEIWVYDIQARSLERLTTAVGEGDTWRPSTVASLNWDGSRVVFESSSDFLNEGIAANEQEVWIYDYATDSFNRVTYSSDPDERNAGQARISGSGKRVAFESDSDFNNEGILNNQNELWLAQPMQSFQVSKSVNDSAPQPGQRITYTIRVTNASLIDGSDGLVSDTLDLNLALAGTVTIDPPANGTVGTLPSLAYNVTISAHQSLLITVPVTVNAAAG